MANQTYISSLISELRKRLGLSQEKLAACLHVSLPTINRWEKGKTKQNALALKAIRQFVQELGPDHADLYDTYFGSEETSESSGRTVAQTRYSPGKQGALDTKTMEGMLWKAACSIRGEKDAPKFKDYILPLIFIKRLSDVYEDEVARLIEEYGEKDAQAMLEAAPKDLVRFYIPPEVTWSVVSGRKKFDWPQGKRPNNLGEQLTHTVRAITRANSSLQGVIDIVDYNEIRNGEREISDQALSRLIEILSDPRYRLGLKDVEPDFLGRAYEYLLRKFAEGQGQSAGEFYTPKEVGWLIAYLMRGKQGEEIYDPCCGSGGLLIKCELALSEGGKEIKRPLKLHGQELTGASFALARMNTVLHDMEGEIVRGNTMTNPKFLDDSSLRQFDIVVTNPMWNQNIFEAATYENDPYERFSSRGGFAPSSSADWGWIQHVHASLNDRGRAAVVIDTGAASPNQHWKKALKLHGQELTGASFALARMNTVLHDMEGEIVRGNTMTNPKFLDDSSLRQFDIVVTNPMWNQNIFEAATYENDPYERFSSRGGFAPSSSADWGWIQHVHASLNDRGRAAVVIDTGAASRGSGSQGENKEKTIRRWFVENDLIEGVILLPDNLFYNTTAAGILLLLNRNKPKDRQGKVILVNAGNEFQKGRPKNFIPDEGTKKIADAFHAGKDVERFVKAVSIEEIAKNDYNLSPSRYIEATAPTEHRDVQTLLDELTKLDEEAMQSDGELKDIFTGLGYKWKAQ